MITDTTNAYIYCLKKMCETLKMDNLPQANDLLYRIITLEDIYLPLNIRPSSRFAKTFDYAQAARENTSESAATFGSVPDIDDLIRLIDQKLAELESEYSDGKVNHEQTSKKIEESVSRSTSLGHRIVLNAAPGAGKTTFCKRLALAYCKKDFDFISKYSGILKFPNNQIPLLLICRNLEHYNVRDITNNSFISLAYVMCSTAFEELFSSKIKLPDFTSLIQRKAQSKELLIIVDGWDEILDEEKEKAFFNLIHGFLLSYPKSNIIITIRDFYNPQILSEFTQRYSICNLDDEEIKEFCKRWYSVIFNDNQTKKDSYVNILNQIESPAYQKLKDMFRVPLTLSHILTLSRFDSRIPENKSQLFDKLVNLYLTWNGAKTTRVTYSAKAMRLQLSYIAAYLTKSNKFTCKRDDLIQILLNCYKDLNGFFPSPMLKCNISDYIKEFERSNMLRELGGLYGFSTHRQMQEYLTADAILTSTADEEYNNMMPLEIFSDKYLDPRWREVVIFASLMNDRRLIKGIVNDLLDKAQNIDSNYEYVNLLFEMITSGVDIRDEDKQQIFDCLFKESITDIQIVLMYDFISLRNHNSKCFTDYISKKFRESIENGESYFGYSQALIHATMHSCNNNSPLLFAEKLIQSNHQVEIVEGLMILSLFGWCKYVNTRNAFTDYYKKYKMSSNAVITLQQFLLNIEETPNHSDILNCVKDCILAEFIDYNDLLDDASLIELLAKLEAESDNELCKTLLSLAPIQKVLFIGTKDKVSSEIRQKYLDILQSVIETKDYDEISFSFSLCITLGCWDSMFDIMVKLKEISELYSDIDSGFVGHARLKQMQRQILHPSNPYSADNAENENDSFSDYFVANYTKKGLSYAARSFLKPVMYDSVTTRNNLAYLIRRQEIKNVIKHKRISNEEEQIGIDKLLELGVETHDGFSMINYALHISSVFRNKYDDIEKGFAYLKEHDFNKTDSQTVSMIIEWWRVLATEELEVEGLIVLHWLYRLSCCRAFMFKEYAYILIELFAKNRKVFNSKERNFVAALKRLVK